MEYSNSPLRYSLHRVWETLTDSALIPKREEPAQLRGKYTVCTTCSTIQKLCTLPTQCTYVFRMILTINIDYFPNEHYPDTTCFL
jgi:hypothetical protein